MRKDSRVRLDRLLANGEIQWSLGDRECLVGIKVAKVQLTSPLYGVRSGGIFAHKIMHLSISLRIVSFEDPDLIMSETLDSFFIDPE